MEEITNQTTSFETVSKVLQGLPVSYYLKRKIDVSLSKTLHTSQIDIMNEALEISYLQIILMTKQNQSNELLESDIRGLLYHEVSHALLTPLHLSFTYIYSSDFKMMNIFEDERIESICRFFYIDVDFKSNIKKVNEFDPLHSPKDVWEAFYYLVRYDIGKPELLAKVKSIIRKWSHLNRFSSNRHELRRYVKDVRELLALVRDDFNNSNSLQSQSSSSASSKDFSNDDENELQSSNSSNESASDSEESFDSEEENEENCEKENEENCNADSSDIEEDEENDSDSQLKESKDGLNVNDMIDSLNDSMRFKKAIDNCIERMKEEHDRLIDAELQKRFEQAMLKSKSNEKRNSSAIASYSGSFNPRQVGRDDWKVFNHKNRLGNVKQYDKIKLNLFIDESGSFYSSQDAVNKLLFNLIELEKKNSDFSFDVIGMTISFELKKKNQRQIHCNGCNDIPDNAIEISNSAQSKDAKNINIVLFDGDAFSGGCKKEHSKNFKAFNNSNFIIISDSDNKTFIESYCKNAKSKIISKNYAKVFIDETLRLLNSAMRN